MLSKMKMLVQPKEAHKEIFGHVFRQQIQGAEKELWGSQQLLAEMFVLCKPLSVLIFQGPHLKMRIMPPPKIS